MPAKKVRGFSKLANDHAGHVDVGSILSTNTDPLLVSLLWHCSKLGAYFAQSTNRARSAVQFYIKYEKDEIKRWANTPEEAVEVLSELLEAVVETCEDLGRIEKRQEA